MKHSATFLLLLALGGLAACESEPDTPPAGEPAFVREGTLDLLRPDSSVIATIDIEIAEDPQERQQGLMFRRDMSRQQGMLFLFEEPDTLSFWMQNTPLPLDIIFIDSAGRLLNVEAARPFDQTPVFSEGRAQYVLELRRGTAERLGLSDSTYIRWQRE